MCVALLCSQCLNNELPTITFFSRDNFSKLSKTRPSATVAVRPDPLSPWRAIGVVNTATDATTYPVAVSRQKRLVSEHAVRLFPGLAGKKTLEFGLCEEEGSEKVEIVKLESTSVAWDAVGFEVRRSVKRARVSERSGNSAS